MDESWDWVEQELKKIQDDMPADADMMQVVDAISVADFWKRRYDEERMLWERRLELKEDERKDLESKAQGHEAAIKELDWKFKELEGRWENEKSLLETRLKSSDTGLNFEKTQLQWEARIKALEDENKALKVRQDEVPATRDREEALIKSETEALQRLEKLETEKTEVAAAMQEKEKLLAAEREKWGSLEKELNALSSQMTQKLNGLREREEEHFVILEDMARGLAHRVRNYLGIISGTVQLSMASYKLEPELEEQLKVIDQNVNNMLKAIEEFLSLARVPEMSPVPVDLNKILDAVVPAAIARLGAQKAAVERALEKQLPATKGDQKMIEELFRNLVDNALEAMPSGGKLGLSSAYDRERGIVTVRISDSGIGIQKSYLKKVFQPYFTSKKNHRGLGLTVAKRIVDLHRGTLALESSDDKGTTVTVNFFIEGKA